MCPDWKLNPLVTEQYSNHSFLVVSNIGTKTLTSYISSKAAKSCSHCKERSKKEINDVPKTSQFGYLNQCSNLRAEGSSVPGSSFAAFTVCFSLGFTLRACFTRFCPSPESEEKWQQVVEGQERSIRGIQGYSTEADPKGVKLEKCGSWSEWKFRFANPNSSFNMRGKEKPWREERKHPLGFVLQIKQCILCIHGRYRGFLFFLGLLLSEEIILATWGDKVTIF